MPTFAWGLRNREVPRREIDRVSRLVLQLQIHLMCQHHNPMNRTLEAWKKKQSVSRIKNKEARVLFLSLLWPL